jgi:hypothetical protein
MRDRRKSKPPEVEYKSKRPRAHAPGIDNAFNDICNLWLTQGIIAEPLPDEAEPAIAHHLRHYFDLGVETAETQIMEKDIELRRKDMHNKQLVRENTSLRRENAELRRENKALRHGRSDPARR